VILIGRMASDPELKYTPSGIPVSQFRLAVNRPMSSEARQNGQEKQADFFTIVAWRQSAEYAANYLGKGRLIAIEGRLQAREYVTQDGQKRRETEVVVDNLKSLDRPKEENSGGGYADHNGGSGGYGRGGNADEYAQEADAAPAPAAAPSRPAAQAAAPAARPAAAPARQPAPAARYQAPAPSDDMDDPFADN
jgi:single-strand DNA-binding protein